MSTAGQIVAFRGVTSEEGASMVETIEFLEDETCLQLGMISDAAMHARSLVRTCDDPDADEADLPSDFRRHILVLRRLFIDGQCLHIPGLPRNMLQTLRRPRTFVVKGRAKTTGAVCGVAEAIIAVCLNRMKQYVVMATAVVQAEFPCFELLSSFRAFTLGKRKHNVDQECAATEDQRKCLDRLAQCIGASPEDLRLEFEIFQPFARQYYLSHDTSNFGAWAEAVRRLWRRSSKPTALQEVLIRYGTWQASSSECERVFSKTARLRGAQSEESFLYKQVH